MVMLLDTSVWIEFFQGIEKSKRVEDILRTEENFKLRFTLFMQLCKVETYFEVSLTI
jgi:predicted nucleic acid-binding protein